MPVKHTISALALALLSPAAGAPAADAQDEVDRFQIQGWNGGPRFDPTSRAFSHCAVSTVLGGVGLTFALTATDYTPVVSPLPASVLVAGTNLIAVELDSAALFKPEQLLQVQVRIQRA